MSLPHRRRWSISRVFWSLAHFARLQPVVGRRRRHDAAFRRLHFGPSKRSAWRRLRRPDASHQPGRRRRRCRRRGRRWRRRQRWKARRSKRRIRAGEKTEGNALFYCHIIRSLKTSLSFSPAFFVLYYRYWVFFLPFLLLICQRILFTAFF